MMVSRYNRWGQSDVLYVGTTFTTSGGDYRDGVPAVSSRHIERLTLAEDTFHATSKVEIDRKFRDRFLVKYIYGFNSTRHVYFVTVQKRSHLPGEEEKGYITRLARVCITDPNYKTYTEVTLECTGLVANNSISVGFFCEFSLIPLLSKSMTHGQGNSILFRSSQQLPRLRLRPLKGFSS